VHRPLIDFQCGPNGGADDFLEWFFTADRGELEPFVLVVEGVDPERGAARRRATAPDSCGHVTGAPSSVEGAPVGADYAVGGIRTESMM
jgi:hypothetical protein